MDNALISTICEYHFQDTVIVVNRVFKGTRKPGDLILEAISGKIHFANRH